jgi:hypothetical protein
VALSQVGAVLLDRIRSRSMSKTSRTPTYAHADRALSDGQLVQRRRDDELLSIASTRAAPRCWSPVRSHRRPAGGIWGLRPARTWVTAPARRGVPSRHSVVPEAIRQVVAQVIGNDAAVAFAENHSIREVVVARGSHRQRQADRAPARRRARRPGHDSPPVARCLARCSSCFAHLPMLTWVATSGISPGMSEQTRRP